MLALAGLPLDVSFRFLDPGAACPVDALAPRVRAGFDDLEVCRQFAREVDVLTFEFENVPAATVDALALLTTARPSGASLRAAQDRLAEKELFTALGIGVAPYRTVGAPEEIEPALAAIGLPAVLKTRRHGYDGRGQWMLRDGRDASAARDDLDAARRGGALIECILERFVPFDRELSILAARDAAGRTAIYPLVENTHRGGILWTSRAPIDPGPGLRGQAEGFILRLLERLDHVGMLALELFQIGDTLLANEMAPRVHNSGHWTIEGAETSQFENHLRAITGLPLGSTDARGTSMMLNLIGRVPPLERLLQVPGAAVHLYGKQPRERRKLGHVTVVHPDPEECERRAAALRAELESPVRD